MQQRVKHHEFNSRFHSKHLSHIYSKLLDVPEKYLEGLSTKEIDFDKKNLSKLPDRSQGRMKRFSLQDREMYDKIIMASKENTSQKMLKKLTSQDHSCDYEILGKERYAQ